MFSKFQVKKHTNVFLRSNVRLARGRCARKVPVSVVQDRVGDDAQAIKRPSGGDLLCLGHPEFITLHRACMPDRPGDAPVGDPVEKRLALDLRQHLRVSNLVDALSARYHCGSNADRARPRSPAYLVEADDGLVPGSPEVSLRREVRCQRPEGGAQSRDGLRHASRLPVAGRVQLDLRSAGNEA